MYGTVASHGRYVTFQLAEVAVPMHLGNVGLENLRYNTVEGLVRRKNFPSDIHLVIAMKLRSQIAVTAVLAVILMAGWVLLPGTNDATPSGRHGASQSGGHGGASSNRSSGTLVLTEPIKLAEDEVGVLAIGTGEALKSASIYPSVADEVIEVAFQAEQRVAKGAVLVRLDDKHQLLAVRLAQVAVKEARRQLKRLEKLTPSGAASISRLETAQTDLESANLRLDQAKAALSDRTIYAPFDGIIGLTEVDKGDRVTEDTLVATLDYRSVILVEFNLPEEYAGRIANGDPVTVRPWTMQNREMQGTIFASGSRIDPVTRSLRVKARITDSSGTIRPGTSFQVELAFKGRFYPIVREVAVLWSRDGAYLWRVIENKIEKVFVKIVRRDRGWILVDGPLKTGDLIVVEGVQGLRVGQSVKPRPYGKS